MSVKIKLNNVRIAFPVLFKPEGIKTDPTSKPAYSAMFILPKDHPQIKEIEAAIMTVATEKWKNEAMGVLSVAKKMDKITLRKEDKTNNKGVVYAGFEGMAYLTSRRRQEEGPPLVIDGLKQTVTDETVVYGGCYVNAIVSIYAYEGKPTSGVTAGLEAVQFFADGEPLGSGGSTVSADDFEPVAGAKSKNEDPGASIFD